MTGTLIFILFLLNILFAFALLLLYMRQNRLMDIEKRQKAMLKESEQVLAGLLVEIKEENERLIGLITEKNVKDNNTEPNIIMDEMNSGQDIAVVKYNTEWTDGDNAANKQPEYLSDPISLKEQAETLAAQGLTVTEIARRLNKGKTEIELLMKFQ